MGAPASSVTIIPALQDNYIYLVIFKNQAVVIDPGEHEPVIRQLNAHGLHLAAILNTHHHSDHTHGNHALKQATGCRIIGPDDDRIPDIDDKLTGGEQFQVGPLSIKALRTSGHTCCDISFYITGIDTLVSGALFCGDTLFSGGCGRVFEGTPAELFQSLKILASLPEKTLVYCGHEYTLENYHFATTALPDHPEIKKRFRKAMEKQNVSLPTLPSTIEQENAANIFLLAGDPQVKQAVDMPNAGELAVFTELRNRKNRF